VLDPNWPGAAMAFADRAMVDGRGMTAVGRFDRGWLVSAWRARLADAWRWLVGAAPQGGALMSKDNWLALTAASPASSASSVSDVRRGAA
jgi:hypothetical protein